MTSIIRRTTRRISTAALVSLGWASWRNRYEARRWASFAGRSVRRLPSHRQDVLAEFRLRAALARDRSLRHSPHGVVEDVSDGVANVKLDAGGSDGRRTLDIAKHTRGLTEVRVRPAVDVVLDRGDLGVPARPVTDAV